MLAARVITLGVSALLIGEVFAADIPFPMLAATPTAAVSWTGFYVGANAGATVTGNNGFAVGAIPGGGNPALGGFNAAQRAIDSGVTGGGSFGAQGAALLGVQAGYAYQFAVPIVLGLEADIQGALQAGSRASYANSFAVPGFAPLTQDTSVTVSKRLDFLGTVRGRLGYAFAPDVMAYVTGGLAYGQARSQTAVYTTPANGFSFALPTATAGGSDRLRVGYTIGGGIEWMVRPNWSIKTEYGYYNLGTANYSAGTLNGMTSFPGVMNPFTRDFVRSRVRVDGHTLRIGVNYHFGGEAAESVVAHF